MANDWALVFQICAGCLTLGAVPFALGSASVDQRFDDERPPFRWRRPLPRSTLAAKLLVLEEVGEGSGGPNGELNSEAVDVERQARRQASEGGEAAVEAATGHRRAEVVSHVTSM